MIRALLSICLAAGLLAAPAAAEEIPPHGWSIRYSSNSFYLTRPDLPNIEIAVVDDIRPDLTQAEKFERLKTFFAERARCPSLAKAKTQGGFAGMVADSKGPDVRCHLFAMGHWQEGALQAALVVNNAVEENELLGGVGEGKRIVRQGHVGKAIDEDLRQFFSMRYEMGSKGVSPAEVRQRLTAEGYAGLVPDTHKPQYMLRLKRRGSGDRIDSILYEDLPSMVLFGDPAGGQGVPCVDWDPSLFQPADTGFDFGPRDNCRRWQWRWPDEDKAKGKRPQIRDQGAHKPWLRDFIPFAYGGPRMDIVEAYKPFAKGARLDLVIGIQRKTVIRDVIEGRRPASALEPNALALRGDGRFFAGLVRSATLEGGQTDGPVQGQYYLDGHSITLLLDSGRVIHGFIGWLPYTDAQGKTEQALTHRSAVNLNGHLHSGWCTIQAGNCD